MDIIRRIYCEGEYLGRFKLQKIKDEYVWTYILNFSKRASSADKLNISKERYDNIDGYEWINSTYRVNKNERTKVVFSIKFEDGDI